MFKRIVISFIIGGFTFCTAAFSQASQVDLKEEANIYDKVLDASLITSQEIKLPLSQLYKEKPVLLALIFTRCAGICNPFLFQLKENLQFKINAGEFTVLVLSFDPRDTREDMLLLSEGLNLDNNEQWIFATTTDIEELNQSVGFNPVWDNARAQYDHDALLVGINKEGYITKKLIGLRNSQDLRLLISSVNDIFSPSYRLPNNNQLFSCFNYNPQTGKNTPGLGMLILALPAIITLLLVVGISYSARQKRI
jgi:cytochrome oxidase Cu insertion factor (SCO1/SenC/PrrC family)